MASAIVTTTPDIVLPPAVRKRIDEVSTLMQIVQGMRKHLLIPKVDFGVIPGTGNKPTLLLPGMEKLMRALNAVPSYNLTYVVRDYDKNLFHFEYECTLKDVDTGRDIPGGRGIGLCTSYESAFRWRWVPEERVPSYMDKSTLEHHNTVIREPKWAIDKGQTNAKYGKTDEYWARWREAIADGTARKATGDKVLKGSNNQPTETWEMGGSEYRITNPDMADQMNSIMKRAKKRALGDAVKGAAGVSEYFTVDVEDFYTGQEQWIIEGTAEDLLPTTITVQQPPAAAPAAANTAPKPSEPKSAKAQQPPTITPPQPPTAPVAETVAPWYADKSKVDMLVGFAFRDGYLDAGQKSADLLKLIGKEDFTSFETGQAAYQAVKAEGDRLKAQATSAPVTPAAATPEPAPVVDETVYEVSITQASYNGKMITFDTLRDGKINLYSRSDLADMLTSSSHSEEQVNLGKRFVDQWQVKSWAGTKDNPGRYTFDQLVLGYKKTDKGLTLVSARVDDVPF